MGKFTVNNLKSLANTISGVVDQVEQKDVSTAFANSLTEKALQLNEEKHEKEESPAEEKAEDKAEMLMKKLAAKALKRAKKKAATNEEVELAEKAAPGYEDWASDPKVKRSFKKQYGKRWKQVMYGRSWKMSKMDEEIELAEGVNRMRRLRRAHVSGKGSRETADAYDKELSKLSASRLRRGGAPKQTVRGFFNDKPITPAANRAYTEFAKRAMAKASAKGKKVFESEQLDEEWGGGFQSYRDAHREVQAGLRRDASIQRRKLVADIKAVHSGKMTKHAFTRTHKIRIDDLPLAKKMAASRAKAKAKYLAKKAAKASAPKADSAPSIMEGMQLDEAGYKRLGRIKGAAYKAELASRGADPNTSLQGLVKAAKLKRAAAEREAQVAAGMARRGGASQEAVKGGGSRIGKSGKYTQKAGALANQRDKALAKFRARTGYNKAQGMSRSSTEKQISRNTQQFRDEIRNRSRSGDFGQDNQAALRARSNFQKRFGRLKGK